MRMTGDFDRMVSGIPLEKLEAAQKGLEALIKAKQASQKENKSE